VTLGLLALCTFIGLVVAYRLQREVNDDLAPPTEKDVFNPLAKAFYSGLMDEAEFKRIQASVERRKAGETIPDPKPPLASKVQPTEAADRTSEPESEREIDEP